MTRYLISFDDGWMTFPREDLPAVAEAALAVAHEAQDAGVWVYGAGLESQRASIVTTDGMITDGPFPETKEVIGGFWVADVPSREEALRWAAKTAVACRCTQEVREILPVLRGREQHAAGAVAARHGYDPHLMLTEAFMPLETEGDSGGVRLAGTLWRPATDPGAGVLLYPGAGPADRDNDVLSPPIREHLLQAGI